MEMDPPYRKICKRYDTPFDAHFITFSCFKRRPFLAKDRSRKWFIQALARAKDLHDFSLWAWVIMPEHAPLLIHPRKPTYSISGILTSIKKPVTNAAVRHVKVHSPRFIPQMQDASTSGRVSLRFWQRGGGFDTNLWTARYIVEKVQYIHTNPVRRGLVERADAWEWSSAPDLAGLRKDPLLPMDFATIPW